MVGFIDPEPVVEFRTDQCQYLQYKISRLNKIIKFPKCKNVKLSPLKRIKKPGNKYNLKT